MIVSKLNFSQARKFCFDTSNTSKIVRIEPILDENNRAFQIYPYLNQHSQHQQIVRFEPILDENIRAFQIYMFTSRKPW